jgi:tetratricopeptide (TPR) repeat protein
MLEDKNISRARKHITKGSFIANDGDLEKALQELYKADVILKDLEDSEEVQDLSTLMAVSLTELGDVKRATVYADRILNSDIIDDAILRALRLTAITKVYERDLDRDYKKARKALLLAKKCYLTSVSFRTAEHLFYTQRFLATIAHKYEKDDKKALQELETAWGYAEEAGMRHCSMDTVLKATLDAHEYCGNIGKDDDIWTLRQLEILGLCIELGYCEGAFKAIKRYVESNILLFTSSAKLDESVTIERALKSLEAYKIKTQDAADISQAKWLAGCTLLYRGTSKDVRRGIRLIKKAVPILKEESEDICVMATAMGEGYIADYHYELEEYDVALNWYHDAMKYLKASNADDYLKNIYLERFTGSISECQKHSQTR